MARLEPRAGVVQRATSACFLILAAALALYLAVRLIEAVWPILVGLAAGVLVIAAAISWHRHRSRGW